MSNSTHDCPVFEFVWSEVTKHPNADRLGCYKIPDSDYTYVLNLTDWQDYNGPVCWIPPDSVVPLDRPEFDFLTNKRVRAKKIRGVVSYGLLVKHTGADLGVTHYEPVSSVASSPRGPSVDAAPAPIGVYPKYDVEAFLKYGRSVFQPGEPCHITVKYHGENHRCMFKDGVFHVGSRTEWKNEFTSPPVLSVAELMAHGITAERAAEIIHSKVTGHVSKQSHWWKGFRNTKGLAELCESLPGHCVYGEIINTQGKFTYGLPAGTFEIRVFDILSPDGQWLDYREVRRLAGDFAVTEIARCWPFDFDKVVELAGSHQVDGCPVNEGIVIGPMEERWDARVGRVKLKCINPAYLEIN